MRNRHGMSGTPRGRYLQKNSSRPRCDDITGLWVNYFENRTLARACSRSYWNFIGFEAYDLLPEPVIPLRHTRLNRLQFIGRINLRRLPGRPKTTRILRHYAHQLRMLLARLEPAARNKLARSIQQELRRIQQELRRSQQKRIIAQQNPDGSKPPSQTA